MGIENKYDKKREQIRKALKRDPMMNHKQAMETCGDEYHQKILKQSIKIGEK